MANAAEDADLVLVGADAVTEEGVVNKLGTRLLALAAAGAGVPCYAVAGTTKLLPAAAWAPERARLYDRTPPAALDGVASDDGVLGPGAVRRAVRRIDIPDELLRIVHR
jgi:translation initiation factor 2B subunit (eIF-2B alpha/beta/delta family)